MKTALIYARVSTSGQEDNYSKDNQIGACRKLAEEQGLTVEGEYFDVFTGSSMDRPELNKLRDRVRGGTVTAVLCNDPDRLSRKASHAYILADFFEKRGVDLLFVNAPQSKLEGGIRILLAEYEREKITDRLMTGRRNSQLLGSIVTRSGKVYGYDCARVDDPNHKRGRGTLVIDEQEAYWVKRIFEWAASGVATMQIARRLYEAGVPTKRGGTWQRQTIRTILNNTTYIGTHAANKIQKIAPSRPQDNYKGRKNGHSKVEKSSDRVRDESEWILIPCPAIIDRELWEAAQARVKLNKIQNVHTTRNDHMLMGMVFCGKCRHRMPPRKSGAPYKRHYFRCMSRPNYTGDRCRVPGTRVDLLGQEVWEGVAARLRDPEIIRAGIERHTQEASRNQVEDDSTLESLASAIQKLKRDEDRLLDDYLSDKFPQDVIEAKAATAKKRREGLEVEYKSVQARVTVRDDARINLQILEDLSQAVGDELDHLTTQDQKAILRALQTRITIYEDGKRMVECLLTDGAVSMVEWACKPTSPADKRCISDNAIKMVRVTPASSGPR